MQSPWVRRRDRRSHRLGIEFFDRACPVDSPAITAASASPGAPTVSSSVVAGICCECKNEDKIQFVQEFNMPKIPPNNSPRAYESRPFCKLAILVGNTQRRGRPRFTVIRSMTQEDRVDEYECSRNC